MSTSESGHHSEPLQLPPSLRDQLASFRRRLWTTKMAEATAVAVAACLTALLVTFAIDRVWDTPGSARLAILLAMLTMTLVVPWAIHRWVWRHRRMGQLARLMQRRDLHIGDRLLGVIELVDSDTEQQRSRQLCEAAIEQVAEAAMARDLNDAAPPARLQLWGSVVGVTACTAIILALVAPAALRNALARLTAPLSDTPRYTFAQLESFDSEVVIPHGESIQWSIALEPSSRWRPQQATLELPGYSPTIAHRDGLRYTFELPPRLDSTRLMLRVGDYYQHVHFDPKLRPELVEATAIVELPSYLQLQEPIEQDVGSGVLSVVDGSRATLAATASRELAAASINGESVEVQADAFQSKSFTIESGEMSVAWKDNYGLEGKQPFELAIKPMVDQPPSVVTQDLPRQSVLLDTEQVNFEVLSADDFGVKRLGISWRGLDDRLVKKAEGEKVIGVGDPNQSSLQLAATFSASSYGIQPQPIEVRLWAEDYLPDRERVYSTPHIFYVLTPEQHAVWITDQMSKWHQAALDVRDREMRLHERNKQLRAMTPEQLADDEMRKELRKQAAAEGSNGRRLSALTRSGEDLLRQAARNPEIGVGHLDRWAEMLQILNDISANRMPSVSDLIEGASSKPKLARGGPAASDGKMAGQNRRGGGRQGSRSDDEPAPPRPKTPSLVDAESSQQPPDESTSESPPPANGGSGRLTLPTTTLAGPPVDRDAPPPESQDQFEQAIDEQADLLAEFEKVAEELNTLLANMEGSTLVKRLKAASRVQDQVAEKISSRVDSVFGNRKAYEADDRAALAALTDVETKSVKTVSYIMDDMQSYFERRRMNNFKVVLDEMRESEVLTALTDLGEEIPTELGMSIAQAEFWSDNLDRWAEDLVDPACGGM